jgi:subtilisin family serine protease
MGYTGIFAEVGVIDSGVGMLNTMGNLHPAFTTGIYQAVTRMNFGNTATVDDDVIVAGGHGTHVAGVAVPQDGTYKGMAPDADLYGAKVVNANGSISNAAIANAAVWTLNSNADVVNLSIGADQTTSNGTDAQLQRLIDFLVDNPGRTAGAVSDTMDERFSVFAASGNGTQFNPATAAEPSNPVNSTASGYNIIAVGATDTPNYNRLVNWSSRRGNVNYGADTQPGQAGVDDDGDMTTDEADEFGAPGSDDSLSNPVTLRAKPDIVAPGVGIISVNNDWGEVVTAPPVVGVNEPEGNNDNNSADGDDDTFDFVTQSGTSQATPHVTGVAALLVDARYQYPLNNPAAPPLLEPGTPASADLDHKVIKSVLLTGTDKAGRDPSNPGVARDRDNSVWSNTQAQPLDDGLGAGQLDAMKAMTLYLNGEENPSNVTGETVDHIAWDIDTLAPGDESKAYTLTKRLPANSWITATLTWDRHVIWTDTDTDNVVELTDTFAYQPLDDLDLFLWRGKWDNLTNLIAASTSTIDNVEHLHFQIPTTDFYTLRTRLYWGDGEVYSLSWWTVPEPATLDLLLIGLIGVLKLRRPRG